MTKNRGIPARWSNYSKCGKQIEGTRFVAFKTPLLGSQAFRMPKRERFSPYDLFRHCPGLGLVVDLSNTTRYYPAAVIREGGAAYVKVACPGHVLPPDGVVRAFGDAVGAFLASEDCAEWLVGVHCTHGVNRTGFLVCAYMIQRMGFAPEDAMAAFAAARGHPIERENYVQKLRTMTPAVVEFQPPSSGLAQHCAAGDSGFCDAADSHQPPAEAPRRKKKKKEKEKQKHKERVKKAKRERKRLRQAALNTPAEMLTVG